MRMFLKKWTWLVFLPLSICFQEAALRLWAFGELAPNGLGCVLPLTLAAGLLLSLLSTLGGERGFRWMTGIFVFLLALLYGTQAVYFKIFSTFLTLFSVSGAGAVFGNFWREALRGIARSWPVLLAAFYPLLVWLGIKKLVVPPAIPWRGRALMLLCCAALQLCGVAVVRTLDAGVMSPSYLYYDAYVPELSMSWFGAVTNLRLDIGQLLKPEVEEVIGELPSHAPVQTQKPTEPTAPVSTVQPTETPVEYGLNVMDIDFDALKAAESDSTLLSMHNYFSRREATEQNEYTGYFEGKNLIWIVAEGFSSWALDESCTPTLCKLSQSGFVFENFYNPLWGVSTSDGEYTALTGMVPKSGVWSFSRSGKNYMPFGFGNQFAELGYVNYAFHNGTRTYYDRDTSHPNMGYDFMADGAGLDMEAVWPPSDVEMIEQSTDYFMGAERFNVYYLTISGHMYYTFDGNMMAAKHQDAVSDLPYSSSCRAYVACQMELDKAVELLLEKLEAAGKLEDTVIVLSGDHYPYALEKSEIDELNGSVVDENFELYRSTLIIWSAGMEETVHMDKYCSAIDLMPTLSNLFGLEYDSRLVMGRDILSDAPALVVFQNRSFITDQGRYNAATDTFTPSADMDADAANAYARETLAAVNEMFAMSANILDKDYYGVVFKHD